MSIDFSKIHMGFFFSNLYGIQILAYDFDMETGVFISTGRYDGYGNL